MTRRNTVLLFLLLTFTVAGHAQNRHGDDVGRLNQLLTRAYAVLRENVATALPLFEEAARMDSSNVTIQRQLGSVYLALGRPEEALTRFQSADALLPSDTTKLQIAYILTNLGRTRQAFAQFDRLQNSADPGIQRTSRGAVAILGTTRCADASSLWSRVYASPYYDTRFSNLVTQASFHAGEYLTADRKFSLFGMAAVTHDTRSTGGEVPVIYSDDYALLGAGIRLQPFAGMTADVQGGYALDLLRRGSSLKGKEDFRAVASYGTGWYPQIIVPSRLTVRSALFGEMYASFGYYSRYHNGIGYAQARAGIRALEYEFTAADLYARADAAVDTRKDFFNNIVEAGFGLRVTPDYRWGISLLAEYHRGTYWGSSRMQAPHDLYYTSFRFFLILDRFLCL